MVLWRCWYYHSDYYFSRLAIMSLNLSPLQEYCLDAIGIDRWQARDNVPVEPNKQSTDPKLVEQLEMVLAYRQQHSDSTLQWLEVAGASESSIAGNELTLPLLPELFASVSLKKQLWSVLVAKQ